MQKAQWRETFLHVQTFGMSGIKEPGVIRKRGWSHNVKRRRIQAFIEYLRKCYCHSGEDFLDFLPSPNPFSKSGFSPLCIYILSCLHLIYSPYYNYTCIIKVPSVSRPVYASLWATSDSEIYPILINRQSTNVEWNRSHHLLRHTQWPLACWR